MTKIITSESVTSGHPDKICDYISDSILDEILIYDSNARVACETAISDNLVVVMGEISSRYKPDYPKIVRQALQDLGYDDRESGFDIDRATIIVNIQEQSRDISLGVDKSLEKKSGDKREGISLGAGDQGMVYGYACRDNDNFIPLTYDLASSLAERLEYVRRSNKLSYLYPDGKTLVAYDEDRGKIQAIVVSCQHKKHINQEQIKRDIFKEVILETIPLNLLDLNTQILVNPTGNFTKGGPASDSGLTGRKLMVDSYGSLAKHGGGAFSGKDPTKVDRSGAYMARYIAKNIVAAGLLDKCEVAISYIIGLAHPVSININSYGQSDSLEKKLEDMVVKLFPLTPYGIIKEFDLKNISYKKLSSYGHFRKDKAIAPWEKTDKVDKIRRQMETN